MIALNASAFGLVTTTQWRVPIITRRYFTFCSHAQGIVAQVAGLASRLVEPFTSVRTFTWGTEEDVCSLPFLTRSLARLRPDPLAFSTFTSRLPEAGLCKKLQDSP